MSTMTDARRGRRIDRWEPEDKQFWDGGGKAIARKNLIFSIFAEHLGFSIWVLWTIVVINLANVGITLSLPEQFWLTAVPNLIGSTLRIPYTFAVPRFGGRVWTTISASLLLIPATLLAVVVPSGWLASQSHDTQFWVLLACAAGAVPAVAVERVLGDSVPGVLAEAAVLVAGYAGATLLLQRKAIAELRRGGLR